MSKETNKKLNNTEKDESVFTPQTFDSAMQTFAEQEIPPDIKKKRKGWLGTVLLFAVIAVSIWFVLQLATGMSDGLKSFDEVIANANVPFIFVTFGALILLYFIESSKYATILSVIDGKPRWKESIKVMFLGKYYDSITPFASGGQAMQIHYLHKKGFSGGTSTAVIVIKFFSNMFVWLMVSLVFMIFNVDALQSLGAETQGVLIAGGWIGWAVNMLLPLFIVIFMFLPSVGTALVRGVVKLGAKLHIIKDEEKVKNKAFRVVKDFRAALSIMVRHPWRLLLLLLLCAIEVTAVFAFPYFVMRAYNGLTAADGIGAMWDVITLNIFATMSVTVMPTPGNSGFLETAITMAFSKIAQEVLLWVVLTWRGLVYYVYIIIGIGITIFEVIRNSVNRRKERLCSNQTQTVAKQDNDVSQEKLE